MSIALPDSRPQPTTCYSQALGYHTANTIINVLLSAVYLYITKCVISSYTKNKRLSV